MDIEATLSLFGVEIWKQTIHIDKLMIGDGDQVQKFLIGHITLMNPKLWFPINYGPQNLYQLEVKLKQPQKTLSKKVNVGIRSVQLVQEPMSSGTSFFFKINNKEVYLKGSNMVPMDYYPDRMFDEAELQWLFKSAKEANYNLLRIWGGGVYLNDRFYELADQYGIMVW
jgi:beta-mannosidase